jgi:hypothetical protein
MIEFVTPPQEQQAIAPLSAIDDKIENNSDQQNPQGIGPWRSITLVCEFWIHSGQFNRKLDRHDSKGLGEL